MLKIAIIGTVGIPASYGGFETAVENIIKYPGAKFTVYCSSRHYVLKIENFNGASLEYVPLKANGFSSILYDIYSIIHAIIKGQKNLLIFGVSGAIIFPFLRFFFPSLHLVTNIDGIEWKRDKWNKFKKLYLRFSEYLAVKFSSKVVTDNKAISDGFRINQKEESTLVSHSYIIDRNDSGGKIRGEEEIVVALYQSKDLFNYYTDPAIVDYVQKLIFNYVLGSANDNKANELPLIRVPLLEMRVSFKNKWFCPE